MAAVGICAGALASAGSAPPLEFVGYHTTEKSAWVILVHRETKEVSSWVELGHEWKGIRVARLDEPREMLVLTKEAMSWDVPLKQGRARSAAPTPSRGPEGFKLLRGDVTWTDATWVYSEDAVVQFGQAVLSALTGVMVVEGGTIRGHLSLESIDGRSIEADEATARMIDGRSVLVVGKLGIMFSQK